MPAEQWPAEFVDAIASMLPDQDEHPIAPDDDLAALGLNSLGRTGLILRLQDEWQVEFPDEVLMGENFHSPATLWAAVAPHRPNSG